MRPELCAGAPAFALFQSRKDFPCKMWIRHSPAGWSRARRCRRLLRARIPEVAAGSWRRRRRNLWRAYGVRRARFADRAGHRSRARPSVHCRGSRPHRAVSREHGAPSQVNLTPLHRPESVRNVQGARLCHRRIEQRSVSQASLNKQFPSPSAGSGGVFPRRPSVSGTIVEAARSSPRARPKPRVEFIAPLLSDGECASLCRDPWMRSQWRAGRG